MVNIHYRPTSTCQLYPSRLTHQTIYPHPRLRAGFPPNTLHRDPNSAAVQPSVREHPQIPTWMQEVHRPVVPLTLLGIVEAVGNFVPRDWFKLLGYRQSVVEIRSRNLSMSWICIWYCAHGYDRRIDVCSTFSSIPSPSLHNT